MSSLVLWFFLLLWAFYSHMQVFTFTIMMLSSFLLITGVIVVGTCGIELGRLNAERISHAQLLCELMAREMVESPDDKSSSVFEAARCDEAFLVRATLEIGNERKTR
jgi:hypothetical protein